MRSMHLHFNADGRLVEIPPEWKYVFAPPAQVTHAWMYPALAYTDHSSDWQSDNQSYISPKLLTEIRNPIKRDNASYPQLEWKPKGYYKLFCAHDRAYWVKCGMCRRDKREANRNFERLITHTL